MQERRREEASTAEWRPALAGWSAERTPTTAVPGPAARRYTTTLIAMSVYVTTGATAPQRRAERRPGLGRALRWPRARNRRTALRRALATWHCGHVGRLHRWHRT